MPNDQPGPVTFVNHFTLSGAPEAFEKAFAETAEFFLRQPGLHSYTLYRRLDAPDKYVNIAVWDRPESLRKATADPDFGPHVASLRSLATSESGVYVERLSATPDR